MVEAFVFGALKLLFGHSLLTHCICIDLDVVSEG